MLSAGLSGLGDNEVIYNTTKHSSGTCYKAVRCTDSTVSLYVTRRFVISLSSAIPSNFKFQLWGILKWNLAELVLYFDKYMEQAEEIWRNYC